MQVHPFLRELLMNFKLNPMVAKYMTAVFLLFLVPSMGLAEEISIPLSSGLQAKAFIKKETRYDLWEKSLVVHFAEHRRALSTSEGFVNASAIINHGAEPELWGIV